jgi:hypothetical protein
MIKRLYAVRNGNKVVKQGNEAVYFATREDARAFKNTLGDGNFFITYGIDHKLYKGQ